MGIVIDTSAVVDLERSSSGPGPSLPPSEESVYLPTIVLAELWIGVELAKTEGLRRKRRAKVEALIEATTSIPFTEEVAPTYAKLYVDLRKLGKQIPSNDLAIAAIAVRFGHDVLVGASDEAHFRGIPGLKVLVLGR